jgi:hypothetical protein
MQEISDSVKFTILNNKVHDITIKKLGKSGTIPCVVIGPASVYLPILKMLADNDRFCLYGIDAFWTKGHDYSPQEIDALTLNSILTLYHDIITKLIEINEISQKTIIIGPSILGWFAEELPSIAYKNILGVMKLNSPSRDQSALKQWLELQHNFMKANFYTCSDKIEPNPHKKWLSYIKGKEEFEKIKDNKTEQKHTEDEKFDAELNQDKSKYFHDPEINQGIIDLFKECALDTRGKIAGIAFASNETFISNAPVPIWHTMGASDGIVPLRMLDSDIKRTNQKKNQSYYILEETGHIPTENKGFASLAYQKACQWKRESEKRENRLAFSKYTLFAVATLATCYLMRKPIANTVNTIKDKGMKCFFR